jgi:hypothetical protein
MVKHGEIRMDSYHDYHMAMMNFAKDSLAAASWVPILVPPQDWRFPSPNQSSLYRQIDLCFPWFNPNFWFHLLSISNLAESNPQKNFQDVIDDSNDIYIICTSCSIYFGVAIACSMIKFHCTKGQQAYRGQLSKLLHGNANAFQHGMLRDKGLRHFAEFHGGKLVPSGKLTVCY